MEDIAVKIWEGYVFLFDDLPDKRFASWPFIAKPFQVAGLVAVYCMFVLKLGPKLMENRRPFQLKGALIVYNIIQILVCTYIVIQAVRYTSHYSWVCQPVDYSDSAEGVQIAKLSYLYFLTKILDLLDTVFFVLRKKHNQVSFLHLYHHTVMVCITSVTCTYLPGGHGFLVAQINAFVHIFMYSYYLITVINPGMKNLTLFKKTITQLQIFQFFCVAIHEITMLLAEDCKYPRWTAAAVLPQNLFLVGLFIDFYIKEYHRKPKKIEDKLNDKQTTVDVKNIKDITKRKIVKNYKY